MHTQSTKKSWIKVQLGYGKSTLIDASDLPLLGWYCWRAVPKGGTYYVRASESRRRGGKVIYLHHLFVKPAPGMHVDHINGNPLDNRRSNLRLVTVSQNIANSRTSRNNSSGFKGVFREAQGRPWRARICKNRKHYNLGRFDSPEEAARAYDAKARELFGDHARLNFPE